MKIIINTSLPGGSSAELKGLVSRGVKAVELDANDHLILTLTDNSTHDLGGVRGTGVERVAQTSSSQEDGGDNVFTVTLTDGSTAEFTVKNGSRGRQGLKGDTGDTGPQGPAGAGSPADSLPVMNGAAAAGVEMSFARGDHVHPTDTSRMAANATPTPAAHAGSHATGGSDAITPASIKAVGFGAAQTLTAAQKAQALENIGAAAASHASTHATDGADPLTPDAIGAMSWTQIWENASPTSAFAAQTISLDLSDCEFVAIVTLDGSGWLQHSTYIAKVGTDYRLRDAFMNGAALLSYERNATINTDGIIFANGYNTNTQGNLVCVPIAIYKIMGVS